MMPIVLAQLDAPTPGLTTGQLVLQTVLQYLLPILLPAIGTLLVALLGKLVAYLHAREKESVGLRLASVLTGSAHSVVAELNATLRPQLEAALADGILTDVEKAQLKQAALNLLKQKLPAATMALVSKTFGELTDTYLAGLIERAVTREKADAAIGAIRPPSP